MPKKKRNRRSAPASVQAPVSTAPSLEAVLEEMSEDIAADAQAEAELQAAAAPVVEAALAQAAASADAEPGMQDGAGVSGAGPVAGAESPGTVPSWSVHESGDIRGVLIQVAGGRLLLPNATIAEVLSYAEPEREADAQDWMLGRFRWRGWLLPLVAFSQFAGLGEERPGLGSKVIVLKALGGDQRLPFFAVLTQGFPRLVTVSRSALSVDDAADPLPAGVQAVVRLNDEPALLPDLLQIETRLREVRDAA